SKPTPGEERSYRIRNTVAEVLKTKRLFMSGTDVIRQAPGLSPLADAIDQNFDREAARLGTIQGQVRAFERKHLKPLKRKERKHFDESFARYMAARENGRKAKAEQILKEGSSALQAMVDLVAKIAEVTGEINQTIVQPNGTVGTWVADSEAP